MNAAVERNTERQVLHSCELPGLAVCGEIGYSQALTMREEAVRFARCFPWLQCPPPQICIITERLYSAFSPEWETGMALLSADLERTPEELTQMCRLLWESAALLQRCLESFPDAEYDYMADTVHPEWQSGSGLQTVRHYTEQLQAQLTLWDVKPVPEEWTGSLREQLEALLLRPDFTHNKLFWTPGGFCCAGYWLRVQIERCQLTGRRLYELGVSAFGRRAIEDTFRFYG